MIEQSKFFLVRVIAGYEENEYTAAGLVVEITPKIKAMISEARKVISEFAGKYTEAWNLTIDHTPLFLVPGQVNKLIGHNKILGEYEGLDEGIFFQGNVLSIDEETFLKGVAMQKENDVRFFSVDMHVSETQVWWCGVYKNSDVRVISVGVRIGNLLQ